MTPTERTAAEHELAEIGRTLGKCLARLDYAGAGIAAIHVNAAIEHLAAMNGAEGTDPGLISDPLDPARRSANDRLASIDPRLLLIFPATGRPH